MKCRVASIALATLLALAGAACGGHGRPAARAAPAGPARAGIPGGRPVAMIATARAALARCVGSAWLRPICPRRVPRSIRSDDYRITDGCASAAHMRSSNPRCRMPGWGYETFTTPGGAAQWGAAWDGREWFAPDYAAMAAPPWHVHVDVAAALTRSDAQSEGLVIRARGRSPVSDTLLNPTRMRDVSFGQVRWYGQRGRLGMPPTNSLGGMWAGHVVFLFVVGRTHYSITVHAWASKERFGNRVVTFERGPSLPDAIATLKAMFGSTRRGAVR